METWNFLNWQFVVGNFNNTDLLHSLKCLHKQYSGKIKKCNRKNYFVSL